MHTRLTRFWPHLLLFGVALALRCYGFTAPLLDYHSWRQADTAAMARNFVASGYDLLAPQVDWGGQTPSYVESEFPLYAGSLALLWGAFGTQVWLARLLTALASALAPVALYALARPISGRRAALYAGLTLALLPFAVYFGRAVMPDSWMLLGAMLALLTMQRWLAQPSMNRFALVLLCGALAPLAKTPNLVIAGVPLLYLAWPLLRVRQARVPLLIYAACFALPALLWTWHARALPLDPRLSFGIGEKLFDARLLTDPQFYLLLARWSVENVLTWVGLPLFVVGLVRTMDDRRRTKASEHTPPFVVRRSSFVANVWLPHFWLLGVLLFLLAGAAGVVGQDYYILPLVGPAAWLIGIGLDWLERRWTMDDGRWKANRKTDDRRRTIDDGKRTETGKGRFTFYIYALRSTLYALHSSVPLFFVLSFFVLLTCLSILRITPLYSTADFYQTLGQRVNLALPDGARVGVIAPAVSEILFYGERKGWRLDPGVLVPGGLASLGPDLGVRYVLIADPWLSERRDVLTAALRDYRRVPVGPYALLLDLQQPGDAEPFEIVWETGHIVQEPFLSAWKRNGGAEGFGLPLSDALDGPEGREQFFEHGLLIKQNGKVKRAPVGRLLLEAQGRAPQPSTVDAAFEATWQHSGVAARLGLALSPLVSMPDGTQIQFFTFGTLEQPPDGQPQLGASGRRLLDARGLTEERQIILSNSEHK